MQHYIKTKHRNRMLIKNLENILRVTMEGPIHGCYDIFNETMDIKKNNIKFLVFGFGFGDFFFSFLFFSPS